jgi:hypothetical protein
MLSMPLMQAYPADFTFGGYPITWVRTFKVGEATAGEGSITKGSWVTAQKVDTPFTWGDGFVLWLNDDDSRVDKGLKLLDNIRELPFFHHHAAEIGSEERILYDKVHQSHDYDGVTYSTFHNQVLNEDNEYIRGGINYPVERSENAYRLLSGGGYTKLLRFAENDEASEEFPVALVGNPYMATLDYEKLYAANTSYITENYQIWTGLGYTIFTPDGVTGADIEGDPQEQFIAPLQAFIVEKSEAATNNTVPLLFTESMTTVEKGKAILRSSSIAGNKLDIVSRNPVAGIRTFIAQREGGDVKFSNLDARKIMNGISDVPEIYTLKPYKNGSIAVGANIINSDDVLIPLGLATGYTGNITLSFSGMDTYDAKLSLLDVETNKEIDLTGLASYNYVVNYVPKKINGEPAVCEDRFFIRISKTVTGLIETIAEKVSVFETNGHIQVVSNTSNPVKEVAVYNLQGALIYKKASIHSISHTIDRSLPSGVYIVKVISEKNRDNVKLLMR